MTAEPIYHLAEAAQRCGVSVEVVLGWLEKGLRHVPLGDSTVYRPRDALIRECWLSDFLEIQSVVRPRRTPEPQPEPERPKPRPIAEKQRASAKPRGRGLGPCPV